MEFRIADTLTDSLAQLTGEEQKAVKTKAFDLQMNPANPGMKLHRLNRSKDKNFWSVRINRDIRLIVHKSDASLLLCYVAHHDAAYDWAERRKVEVHPLTGAVQLVEIRETVKEIVVPVFRQEELPPAPTYEASIRAALADVTDETLLSYGVPREWLGDVKSATGDALLGVAAHLPSEAAEAVLDLATGGTPRVPQSASETTDPFSHPDAQRRFRVMTNLDELERALEFPWDKWRVFLHPEQRQWVEQDYAGPARVSGSAGTGKTIVALHRAVHLLRIHPGARVLLTTFSDTLASALKDKLRRLLGNEPRLGERVDVYSLPAVGRRLYKAHVGSPRQPTQEGLEEMIREAATRVEGHKCTQRFLMSEWTHVVDAWQLTSWEAYRDVPRLGRKTRLPGVRRQLLWHIFEQVRGELERRGLVTEAEMFDSLADRFRNGSRPPYDFAIVDEAQDTSVAQLRFLAALGGDRPNALFFAGDLGQRIFQQPFSWKSLGVDIRGRSRTLKVNYRTSHQIRSHADRLLAPMVKDVDGNAEDRKGTVSVFNGPLPSISTYGDEDGEIQGLADWIEEALSSGFHPQEFGIFVRSPEQVDRALQAVQRTGLQATVLDEHVATKPETVSVGTMHLAKGLEFRAVAVMACDDEVIPLQERIENVGDDADLREVYDTERHLLYVACTRARDQLLVTAVEPASEFLDDLRG